MQTNSLNSFYAKNSFLKLIQLAFYLLPLSIFAQEWSWPLSQVQLDSIEQVILDQQSSTPELAIIGHFQEMDLPLFEKSKQSKNSAAIVGIAGTPSYWYLEADIALEDQVVDSKDGTLSFHQNTSLLGPLFGIHRLRLIDRAPFGNSSLKCDGLIVGRKDLQGFGDAGFCQINPNCLNELNPLVASAVHILWINGSIAGFCSGTLVNNTAQDFKPYVLSAEHCALSPSLVGNANLNRWTFTFNYMSPNCENPSSAQSINQDRIVGANLIARSDDEGGEFGSDFLLLELNSSIPNSFNVFFAGWNRSKRAAIEGYTLHFPAGDILKISQFRNRPNLSSFSGLSSNTHWEVTWTGSSYGFGSTEPGSSGAAIFDQNNLVVGTLTGGSSSCEEPSAPDYFGTFAYHWDQNGQSNDRQLKPWLDPLNSDAMALGGLPNNQSSTNISSTNWQIIPNPIQGPIYLIGLENQQDEINVRWMSLNGHIKEEIVYPAYFENQIPLNLPFKQSGLYLVEISQAGQSQSFKILIP